MSKSHEPLGPECSEMLSVDLLARHQPPHLEYILSSHPPKTMQMNGRNHKGENNKKNPYVNSGMMQQKPY